MTDETPKGLALYLRHYDRAEHGTPKQLMRKHREHGATWIAVAGPWQDTRGNKFINGPDMCKRLLEAAYAEGLDP
jgi:hypothetical protein